MNPYNLLSIVSSLDQLVHETNYPHACDCSLIHKKGDRATIENNLLTSLTTVAKTFESIIRDQVIHKTIVRLYIYNPNYYQEFIIIITIINSCYYTIACL